MIIAWRDRKLARSVQNMSRSRQGFWVGKLRRGRRSTRLWEGIVVEDDELRRGKPVESSAVAAAAKVILTPAGNLRSPGVLGENRNVTSRRWRAASGICTRVHVAVAVCGSPSVRFALKT